jgi:hypothetical protein
MNQAYISPNLIGEFDDKLISGFIAKSKTSKKVNIHVNSGHIPLKVGSKVLQNTIKETHISEYSSHTTIDNKGELVSIKSVFSHNNIRIDSPFDELVSLGNDLSLFALLYDNSLTIRASSFVFNNVLYIICGQSNQGKSTFLKEMKKNHPDIIPISDDHLVLKREDNIIACITPIWDEIFAENHEKTYVNEITFLILDDTLMDKPCLVDILPHLIGYGFNGISTPLLSELADKYFKNALFIKGTPRDFAINHTHILQSNRGPKPLLLRNSIESCSPCLLQFVGESMLPTIPTRATLIVNKVTSIDEGKIYIVEDYEPPAACYFCHRLIKIDNGWYFKGDNSPKIQIIKDKNKIIGEVETWY